MRTVRINKGDLVNTLIKNRNAHKAEYADAVKGYCTKMVGFLKEKAGLMEMGYPHEIIVHDFPPEDHTDDYNRALRMLEMSVDSTIELTESEFRQLVEDDWQWQATFKAAAMKYSSHR